MQLKKDNVRGEGEVEEKSGFADESLCIVRIAVVCDVGAEGFFDDLSRDFLT